MTPFMDKARSMLSNIEQDERFKQAAAVTKVAATHAQAASERAARRIAQQDSWAQARAATAELTEIAGVHQALLNDLVDRVQALERDSGTAQPLRGDGDSSPS